MITKDKLANAKSMLRNRLTITKIRGIEKYRQISSEEYDKLIDKLALLAASIIDTNISVKL
ncbi:MAG: hypothetical protein Crog4KO_06810 [Crocinitomicaceae bacterium]